MVFGWISKNRVHNCFSHPCVVVSQQGFVLDSNKEFKLLFDYEENTKLANIVNIQKTEDQVIAKEMGHQWELNYFQVSSKEYHVLFIPLSDHNLTNIPAPLAVINQSGHIIHFNQHFNKYCPIIENKNSLNDFFEFKPELLQNIETTQEVYLADNTKVIVKYKPASCGMWIMSLTDHSEIEKIKDKMTKSQHLQSLGQLIASISHDFNNMFTATNGFCEMLLQKTEGSEIHSEIKEIFKHISNAQDLSKQLVKLVSNHQSETCSPYGVLNELERIAAKLVDGRIDIQFKLSKLTSYISISNTDLKRIMINLIINSRDAIAHNGNITVTLSSKKINNHQYISIKTQDDGAGIKKENLTNVFKPFFSTKQHGTGLGLANIAEIVKQSGGKINITSSQDEHDHGTCIELLIPKTTQVKRTVKKLNNDNVAIKPLNILLVEDETNVRNIMVRNLTNQKHIVTQSANGAEALEILQKHNSNMANATDHSTTQNPEHSKKNDELTGKFDLLITDASLPQISGDKLSAQAKELDPNIKILIVSGYEEDIISSKFQEYDAFLGKPFTAAQLLHAIQEIFQNQS